MQPWFIYIVLCSDNTYYCGITTDISRRLAQHNAGKGAKYTRARRPVDLAAFSMVGNKSEALKAELFIKKLPKSQKIEAVKTQRWASTT